MFIRTERGQRVAKTVGAAVTHYVYDLGGNLIAEADGGTGAATAEYVALEGKPLAYIATAAIYWVHGDHLGTPQMLTDAAGAVVWDASYRPFGAATVTGALTFNHRFPGQYTDAETGLHYNTFRDYDPATGRYIQSDPIGLQGGWNTYGYVGGNPVMRVDPMGLISAGSINPPPTSKPDLCKSGQDDCGPPPKVNDIYPDFPNLGKGLESDGLLFGFGCPKTKIIRGKQYDLLDFGVHWGKLNDGSYECLNVECLYGRCENGRWREYGEILACGQGLVQLGSL